MKRTQTFAVALLAALLPLTSAAFASDRDHDRRDDRRPEHRREHDRGHKHRGHHGQHYRHLHRHHGHHGHEHYDGNHRTGVVLPFPYLPPLPVIVLNRKHHTNHIELPHSR
jgi:zinc transport system substrate-binding protein